MKAISILFILLFTLSTACKKEQSSVVCTASFAYITVNISDQNGNAVILDNCYTIRTSNNDTAQKMENIFPQQGVYTIISDNYQQKLKGRTEDFKFIGIIHDTIVVNESYRISADECHIKKEGGKSNVIIHK